MRLQTVQKSSEARIGDCKPESTLIREVVGGVKRISVRDALPQAQCMSAAVCRGAAVGMPWMKHPVGLERPQRAKIVTFLGEVEYLS